MNLKGSGRSTTAAVVPLVAVVVALALGACRRFQPVPLSASATAAKLDNRTLADPGLRALLERIAPGGSYGWPRRRWDLRALTLTAFYYHPELQVARAQWQVAQAGVATAGSRPNPSLSVTPQYAANSASGVTPWIVTAAIDWPVETAGKRQRRIERAEHLAASARLALDAAAWKARANVRARLLEATAARARADLLGRGREAQHEVVALLEERMRVGAASAADVGLARVVELQGAVDLAEAERLCGETRIALATAVGVPVAAFDGTTLEFPLDARVPALDRPSGVLRHDALQRRADVLAALAAYGASQSALQLEIARQYPDLRIGPGYEYDQGVNKWAVVGVSIELPVLNRNQGPIGEAEAQRGEAAARFTALQAAVIDELDRALANRRAAERALEQAEALLAADRERLRANAQAFEAGAADRLALRTADVAAVVAERMRLDAQVAHQQALGDLEAAVQPSLDVDPAIVEGGAS